MIYKSHICAVRFLLGLKLVPDSIHFPHSEGRKCSNLKKIVFGGYSKSSEKPSFDRSYYDFTLAFYSNSVLYLVPSPKYSDTSDENH